MNQNGPGGVGGMPSTAMSSQTTGERLPSASRYCACTSKLVQPLKIVVVKVLPVVNGSHAACASALSARQSGA